VEEDDENRGNGEINDADNAEWDGSAVRALFRDPFGGAQGQTADGRNAPDENDAEDVECGVRERDDQRFFLPGRKGGEDGGDRGADVGAEIKRVDLDKLQNSGGGERNGERGRDGAALDGYGEQQT